MIKIVGGCYVNTDKRSSSFRYRNSKKKNQPVVVRDSSQEYFVVGDGASKVSELPRYNSDINMVDIIYPVGSVILNASDAFDPNEYFPGTSWDRYAVGRFLVGVDLSTTAYNMANKQGGLKYHHHTIDHIHNIPSVILEPENIPAHTHQFVNGDTGIHFVGYDFSNSGVGKINIYAESGGSAKYTTYAAQSPSMWSSLYDSATTGSQPRSVISSVTRIGCHWGANIDARNNHDNSILQIQVKGKLW